MNRGPSNPSPPLTFSSTYGPGMSSLTSGRTSNTCPSGGLVASARAARSGPSSRTPGLLGCSEESVRRNQFDGSGCTRSPVALAEEDDPDRPFYMSDEPTNSGLSSLTPEANHQTLGRMNMCNPMRVAVATFDTFAAEQRIERLDAVKIDVEGAEHLVIAGMRASLIRLRPRFVICETLPRSPARPRRWGGRVTKATNVGGLCGQTAGGETFCSSGWKTDLDVLPARHGRPSHSRLSEPESKSVGPSRIVIPRSRDALMLHDHAPLGRIEARLIAQLPTLSRLHSEQSLIWSVPERRGVGRGLLSARPGKIFSSDLYRQRRSVRYTLAYAGLPIPAPR